ncbi:acyltransferase family protein [Paraburkholderia domus]|jgi:Predicted acyltransferases|uniref:Acyltransferase 3 domain-containing protein n=1 Tax=Paraburkholderia domus TaxID=2793075 RepID=A0A9N8QUH0_9BURK|nr:acyltransferase [Paraburkholderia domus]MBK5049071.1 acyltransferase [Burkholderia sp. R-70006]MBK5118301.1 acyltransferase [Burkholderia sp. R-69980]MBK5164140.1 acyltransferase [Burkholderia sp. R-70211]MBK5179824.1 acyltransferase [Burkholderia sp. R-69749]MCI0144388.1 acyltransferase family protein [Paraburkholderia sediminicola]
MTIKIQNRGNEPQTIISIQCLRAIAALLVLIWHVRTKSAQVGENLLSWYDFGFVGVDVFFVISGFIMCFIYVRSRTGIKSLPTFWVRRIFRILPLYWFLTCVSLCIFLLAPSSVNSSGGTTSIWKSFLLIPGKDKFLIENGWTLSYEMYFYALFSLAFLSPKKLRGAISMVVLIASIVSLHFLRLPGHEFFSNQIILEFAGGIMIYLGCSRLSDRPCGAWGAVCAIIGMTALLLQHKTSSALPGMQVLTTGLPAMLFVFGIALNENALRRYPLTLVKKLGDSSYSMYLSHPFALAAAGVMFGKLGLSSHGPIVEAIYWLVVISVTLIVGIGVYQFIETPLVALSRSFSALKIRRQPSGDSAAPTV